MNKWGVKDIMMILPAALDLWIALAILIHALDKKVPWFLWVIIAAEIIALLVRNNHVATRRDV